MFQRVGDLLHLFCSLIAGLALLGCVFAVALSSLPVLASCGAVFAVSFVLCGLFAALD